uniref:Uncharacterized protein LOC111106500 n=1 Tax=Crassostrea virginica TaxID=6565 RepID=A0A8B8B0H1_CRAVI|nr:uncharacterized protein LOC111106500 [Crassostrea virginica]
MIYTINRQTILGFTGLLLLLVCVRQTLGNCTEEKFGTFPYFFGRTNIDCMDRTRRAALTPQRISFSGKRVHMWINYRGTYFEYGVGQSRGVHVGTSLYNHGNCAGQMESLPAGYSSLSVECLTRCAQNYATRYGRYQPMYDIVHPFANMMSRILCSSKCPVWCMK